MITVEKKQGQLIWHEASNLAADSVVTVSENCQAIVIGDGVVVDILYAGKHTGINPKVKSGFLSSKPLFSRCDILGVNTSEEVAIPWGVGGVGFYEETYKYNGTLQASGECVVTIYDGRMLYKKFFDGQTNVDGRFLVEKLRPELCSAIRRVFQKTADQYTDIAKIRSSDFAQDIKKALRTELRDGYGLEIVRIPYTINGDGLEEIIRVNNQRTVSESQSDIARHRGAGLEAIAKGIGAFDSKPAEAVKENSNTSIKLKKSKEGK